MNADDSTLPAVSWLNDHFLKQFIEKGLYYQPDEFVLQKFEASYASKKPDNYMGVLVRVKLTIGKIGTEEEKELQLVFKTNPDEETLAEDFSAFPKEVEMYQTLLPAFEGLLKEAGVEVQLAPSCYGVHQENERTIIAMEDLKQDGFTMLDRVAMLDLDHGLLVVERLAQLHAASVLYKEQVDVALEITVAS